MSETNDQGRGELVIYATEDGAAQFYLRAEGGSVWLTQLELAELFQTTKQNISLHIRNILAEGELSEAATVKEYLTVQTEGSRQIKRPLQFYNLDLILAVGYRVRSPRGTQFRQWATQHLREYLIKGFVLDDERLKNPGAWDYFDELLQRIREIRASEKRFYQKIRDLFALATDYRDNPTAAGLFFADVQNKMLFAVTEHTAAEIIVGRADPTQPNMALQTWSKTRVRKTDVVVAKNYLKADEIEELDRLATMFLDYAEDRAKKREKITMADWRQYVDNFLAFNERPLLKGTGKISHERMVKVVHERYDVFDAQRRKAEALQADAADINELEQLAEQQNKRGKP
ncbi:MAG: virulence RhuM family protein [Thauera sp.]|nr:virulence RhuM family protein [Thauera sp.]